MRRRGFIGLGLCVAAGMSACTGDAFYRRVETLSDDQWVRGEACTFEVEAVDTVTHYDVYVDLRTSDGYPWREIYLIGQVCDTAQSVLQCDTLRCELFDAKGALRFFGAARDAQRRVARSEQRGDQNTNVRNPITDDG